MDEASALWVQLNSMKKLLTLRTSQSCIFQKIDINNKMCTLIPSLCWHSLL